MYRLAPRLIGSSCLRSQHVCTQALSPWEPPCSASLRLQVRDLPQHSVLGLSSLSQMALLVPPGVNDRISAQVSAQLHGHFTL